MYTFPKNFLTLHTQKAFYRPEPEVVIPEQIITISKFFSPALCKELITSFEQNIELETTPMRKSREYAVRVNDRFSTTDYDASEKLWLYLKQFLGPDFEDAVGLNPQLRIYRYRKGHHFGQHYDESVTCSMDPKGKSKATTKWTLLIYLTGDDDFVGGGTIFYPTRKALNVHPSRGMALLHKHGDDCLAHEGELVKSGVKWVLRSDIAY
ncbi:hypothetical protein DICA3_B13652 [Diutina catenulata]